MANNTDFWNVFKFHVKGDTESWENPHIDLAIIDKILRPIILRNEAKINIWRFHRRYKQNEHFFEFSVFTKREAAIIIKRDIFSTDFTDQLKSHNLLLNIEWKQEFQDKKDLLYSVGDNSESGPDMFKNSWAIYARGFSEALMNAIHDVNNAKYKCAQPDTFTETIDVYLDINNTIEEYWYIHGVHSFLHHVHLVYGDFPGRCICNAKALETINGYTGIELLGIRGYRKAGE